MPLHPDDRPAVPDDALVALGLAEPHELEPEEADDGWLADFADLLALMRSEP